jgi:hypothetical protein
MQGFVLSLPCRTPMTASFFPVPSPVDLVVKKRLKELLFAILHMLPPRSVPSGASVADTQFPLLCDPRSQAQCFGITSRGLFNADSSNPA